MPDVRLKAVNYADVKQTGDNNINKLIDAFNENKRIIEWALRNLDSTNFNQNTIEIPGVTVENPVVDSYGINELYLDFYPNLCHNSGFEKYDSTTMEPDYWDTDGEVTEDARFEGNCSLMLDPGQYAEQKEDDSLVGKVDPAWYAWSKDTRYAFYVKGSGGQITVSVMQGGFAVPIWYWGKNAKGDWGAIKSVAPMHTLAFTTGADWQVSRINFAATPSVSGGKMGLRIVNSGSATVYVDAVVIRPDWTGRWAGLYKPGPKSGGLEGGEEYIEYGTADWNAAGATFTFENAYTYMPEAVHVSWFVGMTGDGSEVTSPIDFRKVFVQESFTVNGVATNCYSKVTVTPISAAEIPATIVQGKISMSAICRGAVTKPE